MDFEWDPRKDEINQTRHGVSFTEAQHAFADPQRVVAKDVEHSDQQEERFFCFGKTTLGVLTVRFTYREGKIRIFGADTGEKANRRMKGKTRYRDAPKQVGKAIAEAEIVRDFLPSPDKLIFKENTVKITLSLSEKSIRFFKAKAKEYHVPYQTMIKRVVDLYTEQHQKQGSG